jgi:hypothetical protein
MKSELRVFFFFIFLLYKISLAAQTESDISGTWVGTISVPFGKDLLGEYTFTQTGPTFEGIARIKNTNGKDSSAAELLGTVRNDNYNFRLTKFIYRKSSDCLSVSEVKYSIENGKELLTGKWHGEISLNLNVCPAALSGKVYLEKIKPVRNLPNNEPNTVTQSGNGSVAVIKSTDDEGQALVQALSERKYYALLIGIDNYKDRDIQYLDNPVSDATEIKNVITQYYTFDPANIVFLANPTRTEIIDAFDRLAQRITDHDQLLIFYAGHGIWDEQLNQGYWLPSDASLTSKSQWLSNGTIRDYIGGIKSKHTLLITDACFSGSIFKERGVEFNNSRAMLEMYKLPSRKAMTSGTLKTVPDKSVFVKYLVKDLINNDEPLLSADELFRTFKIAVINNSPNGQVPQYGPIAQAGDEGGDFIFLRKSGK